MKKKILVICIVGLFVLTIGGSILIPIVSADQVDQQQTQSDGAYGLFDDNAEAQSFKPTVGKLTKVQLLMSDSKSGFSSPIFVLICEKLYPWWPITGTYYSPHPPVYPDKSWIEFDFDDVEVNIEQTYYLVVFGYGETTYYHQWWASIYQESNYKRGIRLFNPYFDEQPDNWIETPKQDFCFKIYGESVPNRPPLKPGIPSGTTSGKPCSTYDYSVSTIDPDNNYVRFEFDWGDGTSHGWNNPVPSGSTQTYQHNWDEKGTYEVKVRAKDSHDEIGPWSDPLYVTMSKSKSINTPFLNFLQQHPHLFPIIQQLLRLKNTV